MNDPRLAVTLAAVALAGCFRSTHLPAVEQALTLSRREPPSPAAVTALHATDTAPLSLTLEQAILRASETDAGFAASEAKAAAAFDKVPGASSPENPELRWTNVDFGEGASRSELALRAKPPLPGQLQARAQIATARYERARADAERERQLLATRVRRLFAEAILYDGASRLAADAMDLETRSHNIATSARSQGTITLGDAADLSLRAARERASADRIARRLAESRRSMFDIVGLPSDGSVVLDGKLPDPAALPEADSVAAERVLERRPDVRGAGAKVDASYAEAWLERAELWPWFSFVQFGYDFEPGGAEAWTAGVAVDIPVFAWRGGTARAADAKHLSARRAFEATVREILLDSRMSLEHMQNTGADLLRFRSGPLAAASRARAAMQSAREAGHADERDLLEADALWIEARRTEIELTEDYIRAESEWLRGIGDDGGRTNPPDSEHSRDRAS